MNSNTNKLSGKVTVVTGASIATHLAAEDASVVVNYSSSKDGADKVVAEISIFEMLYQVVSLIYTF